MKMLLVFAAALVAPAVLAEDGPKPAAAAVATPADGAKEKKICRNLDPMIGSNLIRRSCKTKEEWAKQGVQDRQTQGEHIDVEKFRDITTQYASPRIN